MPILMFIKNSSIASVFSGILCACICIASIGSITCIGTVVYCTTVATAIVLSCNCCVSTTSCCSCRASVDVLVFVLVLWITFYS